MKVLRQARIWLFLVLFFGAAGAALAQTATAPKDVRAQLETWRLELAQVEAALQRENLDDRRLAELRGRLEPLANGTAEMIGLEQPRADDIKARIDQLGPAPDAAKGQSESPEVARDRAEQQRLWKEADDVLRLARALSLRIEQANLAIADRRRGNFARQILAQHASILSPWLWVDVTRSLPGDVRAFNFLAEQWVSAVLENLQWFEAIVLAIVGFLTVIIIPRAQLWVRNGSFFATSQADREDQPSQFSKLLLALRLLALNAILPALALLLVYFLFERFNLLPGRADPVMQAILTGLAFLGFVNGLSRAVFAPNRPNWRLVDMSTPRARAFSSLIEHVAIVIIIGRAIDALHGAIVASLPLTIATKGVIAVLVALLLAQNLRNAFAEGSGNETASGDLAAGILLPLRLCGWLAAMAVLLAAALGFIPLASFLVVQVMWLIIIALIAVLALGLIEEMVGIGLSSKGQLGRRVRQITGLKAASLDQASVLGSGILRLILFTVLGLLALAPWGVDSSSFAASLRGAFFGFQVGGVTISLSTIAVAIAIFTLGFLVTRAIQTWLDTRYLPQTSLDPGLRNSIRTIFGYVGIVMASGLALSQLGLSLDKLTIVAGALSVGIGFGLQSIVNNFVSGLILLWERPIRVGDWIVVGEEQGKVRRINVRATEIETFDRASLIIPNSEFISGRVKNWMHSDRTGRIIIPVGVDYSADPAEVEALLRDAALAHREVLSEPKPVVIFTGLGESSLDFELRCFVDVDSMLLTRSELLFDILRRLRAANIAIPFPTRRLEITQAPATLEASPVQNVVPGQAFTAKIIG